MGFFRGALVLSHAGAIVRIMKKPFRIWMTGCMAVVLTSVGVASAFDGDDRERVVHASRYSVDETVLRLAAAAQEHGLAVFARLPHRPEPFLVPPIQDAVSHATGAQVLVFASSLGGTPIVMAAPDGQAEAPMSLLVRPADDGGTEVLLDRVRVDSAWPDFPRETLRELAELPDVVASALG